jgi:hypothetical protein
MRLVWRVCRFQEPPRLPNKTFASARGKTSQRLPGGVVRVRRDDVDVDQRLAKERRDTDDELASKGERASEVAAQRLDVDVPERGDADPYA